MVKNPPASAVDAHTHTHTHKLGTWANFVELMNALLE